MTLIDIYHQIINYDLTNLGKDLIIPGFKVIVLLGIVLILLVFLIFLIQYIFSKFSKKFRKRTDNVNHNVQKVDRKDWVRVDSGEGLYCYYCTKKLTLNSWKNLENYYCEECHSKLEN